jgi:intraflagellar transport protein 80
VWSPDNQNVLYCTGSFLIIKPLQVSSKQTKWKAHEGTVLQVDWNPINNLIVSGGEDGRYKVWDSYGRQLYSSKPNEFSITSVAWAPSGDYFAVGSFNSLWLCDRTGWAYSRGRTESGSVLRISWTTDGTHAAIAGGNGAVCFAQVVDRRIEWANYSVQLNEHNHVLIRDMLNDASLVDELEFGDRVIDLAMEYGYLIVATAKQCYVYSIQNLSAPHIFEVKGSVSLILQSVKYFLLVDSVKGLNVYTYDGRLVCSPKFPGLLPEQLKPGNISLSPDTLAIVDRAKGNIVQVFDISSGRASEPIKHSLEIAECSLNQGGLASDRKLLLIDKNRDLFLTPVHRNEPVKLATIVDSAIWSDTHDMAAAISDQKLLVWYCPNVVYIDKDLLGKTRASSDASSFGRLPRLTSFSGARIGVRRADGASMTAHASPYPAQLHALCSQAQFAKAVRLCRTVNEPAIWACCAALALAGSDLENAELCLAAIDEVDKLQFIQHIRRLPTSEARQAELALYRRRPDQAESILLSAQPPLVWRAIEMNISLHRYDRALDLAVQHRQHTDTVLFFRNQYLASLNRKETNKRFLQLAPTINVNLAAIQDKIAQDVASEQRRADAPPSSELSGILGFSSAAQASALSFVLPERISRTIVAAGDEKKTDVEEDM